MEIISNTPVQDTPRSRNAHRNYPLRRWWILAVLACLMIPTANAQDWIYTTRPGDTLWGISQSYLKSVDYWQRLRDYNSVRIPKNLSPGIRLNIPIAWLKNQPDPVKVVFVSGQVHVKRADGTTAPLTKDALLQMGDTVISADNASATLRFADDSTLLIQSNATLIFDSLSAYSTTGMIDTQLRLERGRIETNVTPLKKPESRFEIITPAAVAAVRGTRYRVAADADDQKMRAEVVDGAVAVANVGITQQVDAGFGTVSETGKPPLPPRQLLPAPNLTGLSPAIQQLPAILQWSALQGATAYRVQLLKIHETEALVHEVRSTESAITLTNVADGNYRIRIRAIDDVGLEGVNAEQDLRIDTSIAPALPAPVMHPPQIDGAEVVYSWESVPGASAYQIQLSREAEFTQLLVDKSITETRFQTKFDNDSDKLYFRMRPVAVAHQTSDFGTTQTAVAKSNIMIYVFGAILLVLFI